MPAALDGLAAPVPAPLIPPPGVAVPEAEPVGPAAPLVPLTEDPPVAAPLLVSRLPVVPGTSARGALSSELAEPAALASLAAAPVPAGLLPRTVVSMPPIMFVSESDREFAELLLAARPGRLAIVPAGPALGSIFSLLALLLVTLPLVVAVLVPLGV
ncbi:MAG: hypothetical protein JF612_03975, partial [Planctomycetia bacterium]|nr:hypothetical protein [Planctomycetia bacterium]